MNQPARVPRPIGFDRRAAIALAVAAVLLVALRVWFAFTLRVNSDEPQHLHVVWAWTQGLLPYRDLFDNHTPLFHILYAPLLAVLGERADIVPLMRLAVIPWYGLTLWLTWRIARVVFDRRTAFAAVAILAVYPTFFARSIEFRPDDAWATAWIAAIFIAVAGPPTVRRAWHAGLLGGLAVAFSIKSSVLITAALVSAGLVLAALAFWRRLPRWRSMFAITAATAAGGAVLPLTIAVAFAAVGAWGPIRYCLFEHNVAAGLGRWSDASRHDWLFPVLLPFLAFATIRVLRTPADLQRTAFRTWVLVAGLAYLALRASYLPLLDKQDILPVAPMLAPFAAAALLSAFSSRTRPGRAWIAVSAAAAIELTISLVHAVPWRDEQRGYARELQTLLRLAPRDAHVMDDKAESIFRPRALYWILENVTLFHLSRGTIADDLPARLVADRVGVGVFDRESGADRAFVQRNYVEVAPHVRVAGRLLGHAPAGDAIDFELDIPDRYAILGRDGHASGTLDGTPYVAPRTLVAGWHRFVPARAGDWAVEWDRAAHLGYSPFAAMRSAPLSAAPHRNATLVSKLQASLAPGD